MNNIFAFHGADSKVGNTMISQSVAELIAAENKEVNVLFISLSGRKNNQYVMEDVKTVDDFKSQVESKLLLEKEFMRDCRLKGNLYVLAGLANEQEERHYFPDMADYMLESVREGFAVIIVDTGSTLDNGLALGGLSKAEKKYLTITQQESCLSRFEERRPMFDKAGIAFDYIILNKYREDDSYNAAYIAKRTETSQDDMFKVHMAGYERQAEIERKTLGEFKNDKFTAEVSEIANSITETCNLAKLKGKGKRRGVWKSFT